MAQTPVNDPDVAAVSLPYPTSRGQSSQISLVAEDAGAWRGSDPPPADEDPLVGSVLSNTYRVLRVLGEGGMGRVYEAQHTRISGKRFAIKALHPEFARRKDVLTRFHREVEAAASISSPHVVDVYDVDQTDDGHPFFVSELLTGSELGDYLHQHGKIAVGFAVKIVRQICRALVAAHEKGVVHRDMKPENVFLSGDVYDPIVKVLDFGISRLEGQAGNTLTKTGVVMGTPSYMAPEQAKGLRIDQRVDVYSVGAILYQCVTGRIPFDRADATATLAAVLTEEPEPPRSIAPELPQHLELIIQKAMAREPEDRYQSMEELDEALAPYDEERNFQIEATGRAPRMTQASMTDAARVAREVSDARSHLVVLGAIAGLSAIAAAFGIIAGVVRLIRGGGPLSGTESLVVALVLAAALSTPTVLLVRHIGKTTWTNTARVVELVRKLRDPVFVFMATYGAMALMVRTAESLVMRSTVGVAWPAWDFLLPLMALAAATVAWVGRRSEPGQSSLLDRLGQAGSMSIIAVTLVGVVTGAYLFRADGTTESSIIEAAETAASEKAAEAPPGDDDTKKGDDKAAPLTDGDAFAAWDEVRKSMKVGNWNAAVDGVEKLLALDPRAPRDGNVRNGLVDLTVKACLGEGPICNKLLSLLTEEAEDSGPDVLFEILTTKGGTSAHRHATRLLRDDKVLARGSKAMQIAYELRMAPSCDKKKALFDRVADDGDHRALRELEILKSRRQCRTVNCCLADDEDLKNTVAAVLERQNK
jgi:tRNA A-37 threonylcarbamoyl transferase component Bud32